MEDYVNLVEILKSLPKEVLHYIIFKLMECGAISFPEIATEHVRLVEQLRKRNTEEMLQLRCKISELWCGHKKDVPKKLVEYMQEFKDRGWINLSQEQIDNSKWNEKKKKDEI